MAKEQSRGTVDLIKMYGILFLDPALRSKCEGWKGPGTKYVDTGEQGLEVAEPNMHPSFPILAV